MPELHAYQEQGARFLAARKRAIVGDEMGLGKSAQSIAAVDRIAAEAVLVVCPASVRPHWPREFSLWSRRPWHSQVVTTTTEPIDPAADLIVCSYATARAPAIHRQLMARRWDALILDEAQNLRTMGAQQTRAIYGRHGDGAGGLLERATHCWGLSGSIAPNGWARELHPHLRAFGVTRLTPQGFDHRFHVLRPTPYGDVPIAHRNMVELKEMLREVYLRRRIEEVAPDLPALTVATTPIEADTAALRAMEQLPALEGLRAALAAGDDGEVLRVLEHASGDAIARLRHGTGLLKVPGAIGLLRDELAAGLSHKVVVFAVHRAVVRGVAEGLADFGVATIHGGTRPVDRQAAIDRFASDPSCRVFIAQLVAGGTGISLVASHNVVLVECSWTPADNAQSIARCRRYGQECHHVLARFLHIPASLDDAITATLSRKSAMGAELEAA